MDKVYDCYILILFFVYRIESQIPAKCSRNPFYTAVEGSHVVGEHGPFVNVFISLVVPYSVNGADRVIVGLDVPVVYNPQIQISVVSGTKRSIFRQKNKTKRSKKRLHTTLIKPEQKVNEDLCSGFIVS